jgi:hypothetical protein
LSKWAPIWWGEFQLGDCEGEIKPENDNGRGNDRGSFDWKTKAGIEDQTQDNTTLVVQSKTWHRIGMADQNSQNVN